MLDMLQRFLIIYVVVFCLYMIYFYFKNKSKKHKNTATIEMNYLMRIYGIEIGLIGINNVHKHVALINSFVVSLDFLIYIYMESMILKLVIMFLLTVLLIFLFYSFLAKYYKKLLFK